MSRSPFMPGTPRYFPGQLGYQPAYNGDRALEALTKIMFDGVNKPSPEGVLEALDAHEVPGFVSDALLTRVCTHDATLERMRVVGRDNYQAAMAALSELDKAKAEILRVQLEAANAQDLHKELRDILERCLCYALRDELAYRIKAAHSELCKLP